MTEELKACPFCSCTDIGEVTINLILEQRHRRFKVYCKACQCRTSEHKTRKEARIYWNTRAQLPNQGGEAVGWHTDDHLTDKSATTYDPEVAKRWRAKGWPVTPLYTHPADQVAEPDAELVELLRDTAAWFADRDIECNLARDIDTKLASMEVMYE